MSMRVRFLLCFAAKSSEIAIDGTLVLVTAVSSRFCAERTEHSETLSWESEIRVASF